MPVAANAEPKIAEIVEGQSELRTESSLESISKYVSGGDLSRCPARMPALEHHYGGS